MDKKSEAKSNTGSKKVSLFSDNEDEEDIFESKIINPHSLVGESKKPVSLSNDTEDEMKTGKVEAELASSRAEAGHQTEKKEDDESLEKGSKETSAEVVSEASEDKKRENDSGVNHEPLPRKGLKTKTTKIKEIIEQKNSEITASKKSDKGDGDAKRDDSSKISSKRGSPLKIKRNLNINVSALLPGGMPPKLKTPRVSESGDKEKSVGFQEKKHVQTNDSRAEEMPKDPITCFVPPPLPSSCEEYVEKPLSFEDNLEKVEVLHSITKDRPRIAVKRKPSTRKARQEAVRTSAIFLEDEDADKSSTNKDMSVKEKFEHKKSESKQDNGGKPLFDEDSKTPTKSVSEKSTSLFLESDELEFEETDTTPTLTVKSSSIPDSENNDSSGRKNIETTISSEKDKIPSESFKVNIDLDKTKSLFDESAESEEDDFFKPTSKKSAKTKTSLFDSGDDSDDNLFGSKTAKGGTEKKAKAEKPIKKKSLFDDSSSDDDLFASGKSRNALSGTSKKSTEGAAKKNSSLKKLDTGETSDDPLSKLSD
ncbi:unnamed protein product [Callosobruchus maculatus]|nr:unnamed protein product [Callosobruchus maculatus]